MVFSWDVVAKVEATDVVPLNGVLNENTSPAGKRSSQNANEKTTAKSRPHATLLLIITPELSTPLNAFALNSLCMS